MGCSMSYVKYKFDKAIQSLREAGTQYREWLASENFCRLMRLTEDDLPAELKYEFALFQLEVNPILSIDVVDDPRRSGIYCVDDATIDRIIARIISMYQVIKLKNLSQEVCH